MFRSVLFAGLLALAPSAVLAQQPCTTDARRVVNEVYRHMLERGADPAANSYAERLSNGSMTVKQLVHEIATSQEHQNRFRNGSDQGAIQHLYRHVLGRQMDPSGADYVDLARRSGVNAVAEALLASAEYNNNFGEWGVPGSGGVTFCAPTNRAQSVGTTGSTTAATTMRFKNMDANNDGVVARREWRGSAQSFRVHDWNGDGVLSGDEVRPGAVRPEVAADERDFDTIVWTESGFNALDRNRDGRVSMSEWYHDPQAFYRVDRNRDGVLSRNEYVTADDFDDRNDRFEDIDANNNGRIERREWHGTEDGFEFLDRNNDNVLSRAEALGNTQQADRFNSLDFNGDGRITTDEWQWSRGSFNQRDVNRDGVINRREFNDNPVGTSGVR